MILPLRVFGRRSTNAISFGRDRRAEALAGEADQLDAERRRSARSRRCSDDERLDELPGDRIGLADHARLGHGRVLHQRALDLERPDEVAGRLDDVVAPPDEPEVAVARRGGRGRR